MGKIITISGPSASGKSALIRRARQVEWLNAKIVPSHTTARQRDDHLPGEYVYNVDFSEHANLWLWQTTIHGNIYATAKASIARAIEHDGYSFMAISPKSVIHLHGYLVATRHEEILLPFYRLSPSEDILRENLERRHDMEEDEIQKRIEECRTWDAKARDSGFPFIFLEYKETVEEAFSVFLTYLEASL